MTSPAVQGIEPGAVPPDPAHALVCALSTLGIDCEVEVQGKLALLLAADGSMARLADDATRRHAVDIARAMGFSHVAIELRAAPPERGSRGGVPEPDAPLPRH